MTSLSDDDGNDDSVPQIDKDFVNKVMDKCAKYRAGISKEKEKRAVLREELLNDFGHSETIVAAIQTIDSREQQTEN